MRLPDEERGEGRGSVTEVGKGFETFGSGDWTREASIFAGPVLVHIAMDRRDECLWSQWKTGLGTSPVLMA